MTVYKTPVCYKKKTHLFLGRINTLMGAKIMPIGKNKNLNEI